MSTCPQNATNLAQNYLEDSNPLSFEDKSAYSFHRAGIPSIYLISNKDGEHRGDVYMNLCEQLKDIIEVYFDAYPNTSINGLAKKSKVGASTLRRILNGSIKGDPSPHTVLNIASATSKEKRLTKLITMFDGPVGEVLKEAFSAYVEVDAPHQYNSDLNRELSDTTSYLVYKLAANRIGTSKAEIQTLLGKLGLDRLESLKTNGLIKEEEGRLHAFQKDFSLDIRVSSFHTSELVKFYKPDQLEKGENLFYSLSESLNREGIKKIKEIQREAAKKTFEVMSCPFYEGEIPYFTVQVTDSLDLDNQREVLQ